MTDKKELLCFGNESDTKADGQYFVKEIARTGIHKDSKGRDFHFTESFFDDLIKKTKAKGHDIFVPLGHPTQDNPKENTGWLVDYWREGDRLFGKFKIEDEETKEGILKGTIRHNSIGLMKDLFEDAKYYLQHVALTFQPMIDGLGRFKAVAFGGADVSENVEVSLFNRVEEEAIVEKAANKKQDGEVLCQKKRKINLRISM